MGSAQETDRKGQLATMVFVAVGISIFLALVAFLIMHFAGGTGLSIANPSCTDFENIPGGIACSSDQDCLSAVSQGGPVDPNVQLRCTAKLCQAKFLMCASEVGS